MGTQGNMPSVILGCARIKMEEGVRGREKLREEGEGRGDPKPSCLFEGRKKSFFILIFESC
jgi:hypothetical protein